MQLKMTGRVALVAGVGDEVGMEIAQRLAAGGATVLLGDKPGLQQAAALAAKIKAEGGKAAAVGVELADAQSVRTCVADIVARHGRIDILVNNGPEVAGKAIVDLSAQDFEASIARSLGSQFHLLREVVPVMQKNKGGRVVNLSKLAYLGIAGQADTAAAKSALFGLTRSIALEMARHNVTVNTVVKGDIALAEMNEEQQAKIAGGIPVKRMGTAADVAYAVAFFASDNADYLTGQTFFVCGGKSNYFSMSV